MAAPAWADFQAGENAYDRGDFETALKEWQPNVWPGNGRRKGNEEMQERYEEVE